MTTETRTRAHREASKLEPFLRRAAAAGMAAAALFFAASAALAFDGQVVSASGAPVAGAEVTVLGMTGTQRTDAEGRFRWLPEPRPPFEVLVVLPGGHYMKPFRVESIPPTGPVTIAVSPLLEENVVVTAGAAPTIESAPANGTTVVPKAEMESRAPANLAQALENVAGVSQVSEGQASVPAIRGLARGRSLILLDGARVSSERRVGASATYLDPFLLEAVEVSRGPGSVAYGSDAIGGVVSARSRSVAPGTPLRIEAMGMYGIGIPGGRGGAIVSAPLGQAGGVVVGGNYTSFGNWDSPDGEVFNSGYRNTGVLARLGYVVGPGLLTAGWEGNYGRDIDRPRNNSTTVRFFYPIEDSSRFTLGYETGAVGDFSRMGLTAFLGFYDQITDQYRFATPSSVASVERADVSANDFQVRGFAERFFGPVRVEAGVDVNGRYGLHALDIAIQYADPIVERINVSVDDAHRTDVGGYVMAEAAVIPSLLLAAGARGDGVTTRNEGGFFGDHSTSNGDFSGFFAVTAGPFDGFSTTAQIARGFRDPVLSDRYFRGPSGRGFITGNPDLEPETTLQYDLAFRYIAGPFRSGLFAYHYEIDNLIERYPGDLPDDFFFRNRGEARINGLELELQMDIAAGFTAAVSAQIERAETVDDDAPLDDIPPESFTLQLRKAIGSGYVQARTVVFAGDDNPGPTERRRPGYGLLDLGAGYRLAEYFELQAYVRNVLDKAYLTTPDARATLAPGISASFTAFVRF